MKNLSIVSKILTILGTFGVFVVAVIIYATSQMNEIDGGNQRLASTAVPASLNMTRASQSLNAMQANIEWLLMATTPADDQAATARVAYNHKKLDGFMGTAQSDAPAQATEISALQTRGDALMDTTCALAIQLGTAATTPAENQASQKEYLTNCQPAFRPVLTDMQAEVDAVGASAEAGRTNLAATTQNTVFTAYLVVFLGLVVILASGYFAVRAWVASPIKTLEGAMNKLAGGNLQAKVLGNDRRDKIGGMARAVQVFKDAGLEKLRLEEEAKVVAAQVEAERAANEAARAKAAAQQRLVANPEASRFKKIFQAATWCSA